MANYTWKPIEDIQAGERVIGIDGKANTVITPYEYILGNQRVMLQMADKSLVWTPEHLLWVRDGNHEFWGTYDYNQYLRELTGYFEYQGKRYEYVGLTKDNPIIICGDVEFAHISGWKKKYVVVAREYDSLTKVFDIQTDGTHTYIANGYVVGGYTNDIDCDYHKIKWNGLRG